MFLGFVIGLCVGAVLGAKHQEITFALYAKYKAIVAAIKEKIQNR